MGGLSAAIRVNKRLCSEVVDVILSNDYHLQTDQYMRASAVRALIGVEWDDDALLEALTEALKHPLSHRDQYGRDVILRKQIEALPPEAADFLFPDGADVLFPSGDYPALESEILVDAVAMAASQLDTAHVDKIVEILRPILHEQFSAGGTLDNDGVILLVAGSSFAEEIAIKMFEWAEEGQRRDAILLTQLLTTWETPSARVQRLVRDHCQNALNRALFEPPACDVLFWKWGDAGAVGRLAETLNDKLYGGAAARALLHEVGARGIPVLRQALFSGDLEAARSAASLCNLGWDAGDDVIARMEELTGLFPDDERLGNLLGRCKDDPSGWRLSFIGTDLEKSD